MRRIAILAREPARWTGDLPCPVRWLTMESESQIFAQLRRPAVDALALELRWLENTAWLSAILEEAVQASLPIIMLSEYTKRQWLFVTSDGNPLALCPIENLGCVRVDFPTRQLFHHGIAVPLPWRSLQLLALLGQGTAAYTLDALNTVSDEVGWPQWTEQTIKAAVHQIRRVLGDSHVQTLRRHGYAFVPCIADSCP